MADELTGTQLKASYAKLCQEEKEIDASKARNTAAKSEIVKSIATLAGYPKIKQVMIDGQKCSIVCRDHAGGTTWFLRGLSEKSGLLEL